MRRGFIHPDKYAKVVESTTLTSVDIIVIVGGKFVLVGKRRNYPAKGKWFLPGARFGKNVKIEEAVRDTIADEIGIKINYNLLDRLKSCEHIYHTNFSGEPEKFGTHYIVQPFVYRVDRLDQDDLEKISYHMSKQHDEYRWMSISDLLLDKDVHTYTKNYFRLGNAQNVDVVGGW
jgi:colanic acid biosynthesis protein WcaH